jgi:hypothetical protein
MYKKTFRVAAVVATLLIAPATTMANPGGVPHSTKACPTHSHSGKHNGAGKGQKKGSTKGKKCGASTSTTGSSS